MAGRIRVAPKEDRTSDDGILFASRREMQDYVGRFRPLARSGAIKSLELQVRYPLHAVTPKGEKVKVTSYVADFVVTEHDRTVRIYDSKGMRTERYKIIKRWFEAEYDRLIVEI